MPLILASRRRKHSTLVRLYPGASILDLTSRGSAPWVQFSPFYPHGRIPVPFSPGAVAWSVEGIWQGLKVFEKAGVDLRKFEVTNMRGIKRTTRKNGRVLGHQRGVSGEKLLSYLEARRQIYLPAYGWVLEQCLQQELKQLRRMSAQGTVVLLDYELNENMEDLSRPLSHVSLVIKEAGRAR